MTCKFVQIQVHILKHFQNVKYAVERDPWADQVPDAGISSPRWLGNASGSPRRKLLMLLARGKSGAPIQLDLLPPRPDSG